MWSPSCLFSSFGSSTGTLFWRLIPQLDKLGLIYQKLHRPIHAFANEIDQEESSQAIKAAVDGNTNNITSTNTDLKEALSSIESFDQLYIVCSFGVFMYCRKSPLWPFKHSKIARGIEWSSFWKAIWPWFISMIKTIWCLTYSSRGRYTEASDLWDTICSGYFNQGWRTISINLIERLAICQKVLKNYTRYSVSCFRLIQSPQLICLRSIDDYFTDLSEYSSKMDTGLFFFFQQFNKIRSDCRSARRVWSVCCITAKQDSRQR